jgi:hypothetical protein
MSSTTWLLCMGLFSMFLVLGTIAVSVWDQSVYAFAALKLRRTPRFALRPPHGCATRSPKGEAWWARQDSNLQPDRYERPALTIELQAPPRTGRAERGRQRCGDRLQRCPRSRNARFNPPKRRRIPPLCATSRSRRRPVCRIRPASSALECRRSRRAGPRAWGPSAPRRPPC